MSDKIDEIRDRHSKRSEIDQSGCYRLDGFTYMGSLAQSQEDVATLLAEDERLTGKLKLVADALNETISKYHEVGDQNDRLDAENEKLRAEIERLHQAHQAACKGGDLLREEIERLREVIRTIRARCVELDDSDAVSETLDIATAALEGKP